MPPWDPQRHGPRRLVGPGFHATVYAIVRQVPPGFVATYGDVAAALGSARIARHVGHALAALPEATDVPWWRVVLAEGRLARAGTAAGRRQAVLLRRDGVTIARWRVVGFAARRWRAMS